MSVSIGNGQFHGGCFKLTPAAVIDDGVLDVCIIGKTCKLKFLFNIPQAIRGTHGCLKETSFFKAKEFSLSSRVSFFVHFDGEVYFEPIKNIKIEILPSSLEIFVP
jgi:diacylglycerol kinase family enzyme